MALILNLETATKVCSAAVAQDGNVLAQRDINNGYSHSENLTVFVQQVLEEAGKSVADLDAVAVSKGPGSYTGLRIGVSTAKGLCYGLGIKLISVDTLQAMALGVSSADAKSGTYLPMIDARRMEVYTAAFNAHNESLEPTKAVIVDEHSFVDYLSAGPVFLFGDGAEKCRETITHENAHFLSDVVPSAGYMASLAEQAYQAGAFEDVAYFEPFYLKDFVAGKPKKLV